MKKVSLEQAKKISYIYSPLKTSEDLSNCLFSILSQKDYSQLDERNIRREVTSLLYSYYPNEASIKSAFLNKKLFNSTQHVVCFEMPVGTSRADLCKVGKYSTVYEIKTDLDNLNRLEKQLSDYQKVFDYTYVICSEKRYPYLQEHISNDIGIYTYSQTKNGDYKFALANEAVLSKSQDCEYQLSLLNKREKLYYAKLCDINAKCTPSTNDLFKQILRERYLPSWLFLQQNRSRIFNIDYQFFFKNNIDPDKIYL